MTGGLAAALLPVVEKSGAIWVGSSGRVRDGAQKEPFAEIEALGAGALAMLDLPAAHYGGYYEGFANSALWPALHSRADRIFPAYAVGRAYHDRRRAASSPIDRDDAGLRFDRIPDPRRLRELSRLCFVRSWSRYREWRHSLATRQNPCCGISDRHRCRKIRRAIRQGRVPSRCLAVAAKPERREASDRRRSVGLFQW